MTDDISKIKEEEQDKLNESGGPLEIEPERGHNRWLGGVVLIGVGLFFLLGNVFSVNLSGNWWAVFILIPAIYNLERAWRAYQSDGYLSEKARSSLIGGLLIGAVAFIFLFGLSFGDWWPLFLIIVGIGALLKRR
jgi:hypothetical protein